MIRVRMLALGLEALAALSSGSLIFGGIADRSLTADVPEKHENGFDQFGKI
jgi:hypothetical protein